VLGRIARPGGDEVIDAAGGTVLPGLIDAHMHLVPGAPAQSLTFGVTTVLDMFSKPDLVARPRSRAAPVRTWPMCVHQVSVPPRPAGTRR
jgi:predicted amidohydrolase YtcJ